VETRIVISAIPKNIFGICQTNLYQTPQRGREKKNTSKIAVIFLTANLFSISELHSEARVLR